MADKRTEDEIDIRAQQLHAVWLGASEGEGLPPRAAKSSWEILPEKVKEQWRRVARSVRGVVNWESSTSGGWPTASQADKIRELRERHPESEDWFERFSYIGETRPYGEMVVVFTKPNILSDTATIDRAYLIHPDGCYEELHKYQVSEGSAKVEASS